MASSTITSTSTLAQVFAATIPTPTATDESSWTTLTPLASSTVTSKVGLFGADLTSFYADCAVASALCTASAFSSFTGWAIGVQFTLSAAAAQDDMAGICFESTKNCV